jgi:hypothetical protein
MTLPLAAQKVHLAGKLQRITEHWSPRIVGELNGQQVKLAKLEPASTLNTGNVRNERTIESPERL